MTPDIPAEELRRGREVTAGFNQKACNIEIGRHWGNKLFTSHGHNSFLEEKICIVCPWQAMLVGGERQCHHITFQVWEGWNNHWESLLSGTSTGLPTIFSVSLKSSFSPNYSFQWMCLTPQIWTTWWLLNRWEELLHASLVLWFSEETYKIVSQ